MIQEDNIPLGNRRPPLSLDKDLNSQFGLMPHSPLKQTHQDSDSLFLHPSQREKDALGLLSDNEQGGSESQLSEISVSK